MKIWNPLFKKRYKGFPHVLCCRTLCLSDGGFNFLLKHMVPWAQGHLRVSQTLAGPQGPTLHLSTQNTCTWSHGLQHRHPGPQVDVGSDRWGEERSRWLRTYPGEAGRQRWRQKEAVCLGAEAVGLWLVLHCPVWLDLQSSNSKRQLTTSRWWPQSIKPQGGAFWVWVLVKIA